VAERPDAGWRLCEGCRIPLYGKRLARNLDVCPDCDHHHRLTAIERVRQLFDPGSTEVLDFGLDLSARAVDVLDFTDVVPYPERLADARRATGLDEAVLVLTGQIDGRSLVAAVMDFGFLGGSLGALTGELVTRAAELALDHRVPLLIVSASGGARMQEGPISLMQLAKTSLAFSRLDEAGILTISLVTDPTFGGVAASFVGLCDVILAEPAARMGFAGRRVIEQTIRQSLPPDFQTAEFLLRHGLIDLICARDQLRPTLGKLLSAVSIEDVGRTHTRADVLVHDPHQLVEIEPWRAVQQARELNRPTTLDYLALGFDEFEELHGDRIGGDCVAIVGGIARLDGRPVMVIGTQKGRDVAELAERNYGMATPQGYRKAVRLMRLAGKLAMPVVTFVDTPGAFPGVTAEEGGQALAIAESIRLMTGLPVPVVVVLIGEGGSGGALALAVGDEVLISERGVYSVISPEGCAAILWKDPAAAPAAAAALRLDARNLLRLGVVDGVIREPPGGSQADHREAALRMRSVLAASIRRLSIPDSDELVAQRRARFRSFGSTATAIANEMSGGLAR
jgi:acyl-CoA carboxylase subunit beta